MKRIVMINTGGTFSSQRGENGLSPKLTGTQIRNFLGEFEEDLELSTEDYCALDSSNITPEDWVQLADKISQIIYSCDGVVIIHGTDTMAYTASMLSFMLQNLPIPVVLTGSQLPIGVPMSDAVNNCRCAVQMAASGLGGVYVAFDHKLMLGCRTSKVRTVSFNAFESINYPYVGEVNALGMQLYPTRLSKPTGEFQLQTAYSDKIAVLKLFPGMRPDLFSFLQEKGYEGIYIEGFGLGGVPFVKNDITEEISKASTAGIPILVGSQCSYEGSNLGIYETGLRVLESGGIPVHDMTQEAIVTKLMWCLGQTKDREKIHQLFHTNLIQEVTLPY